jgi:hypothetical protein
MVNGPIACNGQQLGAKSTLHGIKTSSPVPRPQKRFLGEIFGDNPVPDNSQHHRKNNPAKAIIQIRHGLRFTPLQRAHQHFVIGFTQFKSEDKSGQQNHRVTERIARIVAPLHPQSPNRISENGMNSTSHTINYEVPAPADSFLRRGTYCYLPCTRPQQQSRLQLFPVVLRQSQLGTIPQNHPIVAPEPGLQFADPVQIHNR